MAALETREELLQRLRGEQGQRVISSRPQPQKTDFSLGQTIKNIPRSAGRFLGDVGSAIKGVFDPRPDKNIFSQISSPIAGVVEKAGRAVGIGAARQKTPDEQAAEQVASFFKERYGGVENIQRTVQEDPVGFLADISALFTAGGGALAKAGTVSRIARAAPTLSKAARVTGQAAKTAGLAVEPFSVAFKGASIATKPFRIGSGALIRESLGVTTGAGGDVIKEAFRNPTPEFKAALRGEVTTDNVLTVAREGLDVLKEQRATNYRKQLTQIQKATEPLDISDFRNFIDGKLKQFNIRRTKDGLDFRKSVIADTTEQSRIGEMVDATLKWDDATPAGLDILKQRLDDFYTTSGKGRVLTNAIRDKVRTTIASNVPGYGKMTKDYAEATQLIKEIESTLSLKQGARVDTTIKKLMSALKGNNEFRRNLVNRLDELTETNITSQLAGTALSPGVPSGLIGRSLFANVAVGGAVATGLGFISPTLLSGLLLASPRIVGELLRVLGMGNKAIQSVLELIKSSTGRQMLQAGFQAERANQRSEK